MLVSDTAPVPAALVGPIDELEVDPVPTRDVEHDTYYYGEDDDDATEISQRSCLLLMLGPSTLSPTGRAIRMEGWLNHKTSSNKDHAADGTPPPPSSSSSASILSKTVSKKKRQAKKKQPRYFVLRGSTLSYYARRHDVKAKGTFVLTRGCTIGPVMYGSLDDPLSSASVVTEQQTDEVPMSPGATPTAASISASTVTEQACNHTKIKKKKRRLYSVRVTWPIDEKPSKDEKFMAQAKAQVAAESEREALIQQQQQQQQLLELQYVEHSLENVSATACLAINEKSSPIHHPKQLIRRGKPDSMKSPRRSIQQHQADRHALENLPLDIYPPNLSSEDENGEASGGDGRKRPRPKIVPAPGIRTPASALSGTNAFHGHPGNISEVGDDGEAPGSSSSSLNHETGLHKHYTQQIEKHTRDRQKSEAELAKVMQLLSRKASHQKAKKRVIQGTKVAAVSTAAITAGVLTAGIGLAAGLVFVGITAAAGGSGAVVGSKMLDKARGKYHQHQSQKSFHLIIGSDTYEEVLRWKAAMERVIKELVLESDEEGEDLEWSRQGAGSVGGDHDAGGPDAMTLAMSTANVIPLSPKRSISLSNTSRNVPNTPTDGGVGVGVNHYSENFYQDLTPKWVPIQGGGIALWGILSALGGGGGILRICREERSPHASSVSSRWLFSEPATSAFPAMRRFRPDVGLAGQPFPPFKASVSLKANSLDAFMCLMCSGRIHSGEHFKIGRGDEIGGGKSFPVPNSGQIASFSIIETIDDHMDVIHLVFRPLYLFPSWTTPRDFVLYRFWKYDDDGTYQICFDSGRHRDCPPVLGYVRGEMHSVYTIAPLKRKKKRGASASAAGVGAVASSATAGGSRPNLINEECLLSHVVQIDPRGWVPTTSSLPFFRNQGYGDAFAIMALHQMLDVKEALDSVRFVAVPMDGTQGTNTNFSVQQGFRLRVSQKVKHPRALPASSKSSGGVGASRLSRGLVAGTSGRAASMGSSEDAAGGQQQQLYVPMLDRSVSEYASEDEEPDSADYDFKYSGRELFSAEGYHQSPPPSSSANIKELTNTRIECPHGLQPHDLSKDGMAVYSSISIIPPPMITKWWAEPDANSFRVRGKNYKADNKKVNAGSSLFRLFAVDIVETDIPIMTGMCLHPKERYQLALQRDRDAEAKGINSCETPPFVFVVNIALPGPPNYHMVFYYAVDDISMVNGTDGTPSSKLCQEFFFSRDDVFRDNTFKLIPQIIEGNFMVRKAVGSTPAIMGNKIKQTYIQGERFFELMIDTGSSAVAAGVIRICNGYAKMIVVDLAFLFEGYSERTLPERVLGCVRLKNVEFGKKLRFVESAHE